MKCPNCGVESPAGAAECSGCGVIFAKLKAKKERIALEAQVGLAAPDPIKAGPAVSPCNVRLVAAGVVALWMIAFGLYYRHAISSMADRRSRIPVKDRPTVLIRDRTTGMLRPIPVVNSLPRRTQSETP